MPAIGRRLSFEPPERTECHGPALLTCLDELDRARLQSSVRKRRARSENCPNPAA